MRRSTLSLRLFALAAPLLFAACADDESSVFDPAADRDPPSLLEGFAISNTNNKVYVHWATDEAARVVLEYGPENGTVARYAYSGQKGFAEAGTTQLLDVESNSTYDVLAVRVTDRAGNTARLDPPEGVEKFTTETVDPEEIFTFVMIDVGWGDALFMRAPDGTTCLVDAGHPEDSEKVIEFLDTWFLTRGGRIDFASLSHVHEDHVGGFYGDEFNARQSGVLEVNEAGQISSYEAGTFLDILDKTPGTDSDGPYSALQELLQIAVDTGRLGAWVKLQTGASSATHEELQWGGGVQVDLLAAGKKDFLLPDYFVDEERGSVQNNDSMVYRVQYGNFVLLLMGDGEFATEQFLQSRWPLDRLEATVLKLGHHGSNDSNSERFIEIVSPIVAVIPNSVSENPGVEHPYVLNRLRERGIDYFASDRAIANRPRSEPGARGDVWIRTNGEDFGVSITRFYFE